MEPTIETNTKRKYDGNNTSKANNDSNNSNSHNKNKEHVSNTNTTSKETYKNKDNYKDKKNGKSSKEQKQKQETKETSADQNTSDRKGNLSIFKMGDSMVKKLNDYLLTKKIKHKGIVQVRPFTTEKVSCMQDHVKPTIRDINPQQIILHVGTDHLKTERTARQITKSIIDLSISLKKNGNMIAVSGIVPRLDELNNKAAEVNNRLELMCKQRGLPCICHCETIDPNKHLNESNLHLNSYGIKSFCRKFFKFFVQV